MDHAKLPKLSKSSHIQCKALRCALNVLTFLCSWRFRDDEHFRLHIVHVSFRRALPTEETQKKENGMYTSKNPAIRASRHIPSHDPHLSRPTHFPLAHTHLVLPTRVKQSPHMNSTSLEDECHNLGLIPGT